MRRAAIAVAILLVAAPAVAGQVVSRSGARAQVADAAAGPFQCLVDRLEGAGYPIRFMGGWRRHGSVRHSLHPAGLALDVNQIARNVTRPRMPAGATGWAASCGVLHGAIWRNPDAGHFQIGGEWPRKGRRRASRRHR